MLISNFLVFQCLTSYWYELLYPALTTPKKTRQIWLFIFRALNYQNVYLTQIHWQFLTQSYDNVFSFPSVFISLEIDYILHCTVLDILILTLFRFVRISPALLMSRFSQVVKYLMSNWLRNGKLIRRPGFVRVSPINCKLG